MPAQLLLQVAASDVMSATLNSDGVGYTLTGTQRALQDKRISQIADYIDRVDASFPNSIILAANYNRETGFDENELEAIESDDAVDEVDGEEAQAPVAGAAAPADVVEAAPVLISKEWTVSEAEGVLTLTIPSADKLAAIIDGQHRLFSFTRAGQDRLEMELLCAVFLDLPKPFQAQLAAAKVTATLGGLAAEGLGPAEIIGRYFALVGVWMRESDYRDGSPITTTVLEMAPQDEPIRAAAAEAYGAWAAVLAQAAVAQGMEPARASRLARLSLATLDGALVQCRIARDEAPLTAAAAELAALWDARWFERSSPAPTR
jgi:hypothetical protein